MQRRKGEGANAYVWKLGKEISLNNIREELSLKNFSLFEKLRNLNFLRIVFLPHFCGDNNKNNDLNAVRKFKACVRCFLSNFYFFAK